ncbi:energy transducer TonB [Hyphococcus sp.]|uniref:energy transducer TonB n=1 Tax=Hyphococcus sp. TaxID=2038636 RepID=UPI002084FA89|nr:MAG: hypothetical protein DHS20C04_17760 [Marinicaulis sp.]
MNRIFIKVAGIAAASAMLAVGTAAAQDKTYLIEYKLYNAALEAGDTDAAIKHAHTAWQAAEKELGDNNLTAVLAFNYGQLVLFSDPENATSALRRASELQAAGIADLPADDLELYLAFVEFAVDPRQSRKRDAFRDLLSAIDTEGQPRSSDIAMMWLRLASGDVADEHYDDGVMSAARAETLLYAAEPKAYRRHAEALLLLGVATMFRDDGIADDIIAANQHFIKAGKLFPLQNDIATFDRTLALILAWNQTAAALLESKAQFQATMPDTFTSSRIRLAQPENDIPDPTKFSHFDYDAVFPASKPPEECNIDWEKRDPPKYPRTASNKGYVGSALVGYRINADLSVENTVILAEVPGEIFGQAAVDSMTEWRLAHAPNQEEGCIENRLTVFSFILVPR